MKLFRYVERKGLKYMDGPANRNLLQFADGSLKETVGQLKSRWIFASGESVAMTFEVLEECCANVIIGEDVLWEHKVFEKHTSSIIHACKGRGPSLLAPFDIVTTWQKQISTVVTSKSRPKQSKGICSSCHEVSELLTALDELETIAAAEVAEELRRDLYKLETNFGNDANSIERELEEQRRTEYRERTRNLNHQRRQEPSKTGLLRRIKHRFKHKFGRSNSRLSR